MADYDRDELARTISKLRAKIKRFRDGGTSIGEENTKATLIEPLLAALGWDIEEPEEVHREYKKKPQDAPVDYALCMIRTPRLFVEAKSLEKNIVDRRWSSQVLGYATVVGVEWCVLTNGDEYRLYNAHAAVDVEEKLFRSVILSDRANDSFLLDSLDLLSKARLQEKRLKLLWDAHHVDRQVGATLERLWSKPEPAFVRLIRKHAKGLTPKEVQASLQRGRLRVDFPAEVTEPKEESAAATPRLKKRRRAEGSGVKGLPRQADIEVPLLREIARLGGNINTRTQLDQVADALASEFGLSPRQRDTKMKDSQTTVWKNRIQWARLKLVNSGDLDGSQRGVWSVTAKGEARARKGKAGPIGLVRPGGPSASA